MLCPFATYRPVVNHSGSMADHWGMVVHVQVGDGSCFGLFNNPSFQASAHFWVSKTGGVLEQYVDTANMAWAQEAGNPYYVSVETEGVPSEPLTSAQIAILAKLYAWLHQVHGIPLQTCDHGGRGITTHSHYPSGAPDPAWGDHPCPGDLRRAQIPAILAAAQGPSPPPHTPPPSGPTGPPVTTGDIVTEIPAQITLDSSGNGYDDIALPAGKQRTDVVGVVVDVAPPDHPGVGYPDKGGTTGVAVDSPSGYARVVFMGWPAHAFLTYRTFVA